ncbi:MAG: hypothetical protein IKB34_05135 [Clostridia bacterium]|nr:hypothetical protein [Clostridia bacterium]
MNEIEQYVPEERKTPIDTSRLLRSEYTFSLIREAVRVGRLTEEDSLAINAKLYDHLRAVTEEYTDGKSSSLPTEEMNELYLSLIYNVDAYLISLNDAEKALDALQKMSVTLLYDNGGNALKRVQTDCAALLFNVKKSRLIGATEAYNRTIDEDIRAFLKEYHIRFGAHKSPLTPRYRLAIMPGGGGVVRIKRYLTNLLYENAFCSCYASDEVIGVVSYEVMRSRELGRDIGNLYVPVMLCAVVCQFLMPGYHHVLLSEEDVNEAAEQLSEYSPDELREVFTGAFNRLPADNMFYHQKVFAEQLPKLIHAVKHGQLKTMIAYLPNNSKKPPRK